jgi:Flp pilus assembly protein TadB
MKKLILLCICLVALAISLPGQTPTTSPIASPSAATAETTTTTATTATPTPTTSASPSDLADRIHQKLEKKLRSKHGFTIDTGHKDDDADLRKMREFVAIPIVAIVFLSIFGAPVLIVIMIGIFALLGSRMRQRTIRMMVEKGQPVPAELLAPEVRAVRRRSDVRRGVVWTMVGLGLMIWLAAVNDWEGGAWSFGLIPFLIGLGYLIVWKLEGKKDIPPPPPAP